MNLLKLIRETPLIYVKFFFQNLRDNISVFISPRQKWLTKVIPKTWTDKDDLMRICLFEMLVHFVEEEEGVKLCKESDWEEDIKSGYVSKKYVKDHVKWCKKVLSLYAYITGERPSIVKKFEQDYSLEIEEELFKKDTAAMVDIVKTRGYMWT